MVRERRRIAFFGGTFDPVHNGHLAMALAASEHLRLHRVYLAPAARNPLKKEGPTASNIERLEMLRLALADHFNFSIWEGELGREGPSYTIDSVQHIERVYPNCHLFWIIGSDQIPLLPNWYRIEELVQKVHFILVQRPGFEFEWPGIPGLSLYPVENPLVEVSSTEIRERLRKGLPVHNSMPPAVEAYVQERGIYRAGP